MHEERPGPPPVRACRRHRIKMAIILIERGSPSTGTGKEGMPMKLGYIGLGKMGLNMVERLLEKGHQVAVFDRGREAVEAARGKGAEAAGSPADMVTMLPPPRLVWVMVPYGAVDAVLAGLVPLLARGDTVIDGGNSPYRESVRRSGELAARGVHFLDAGVSGGPGGARTGAC